MKGQEQTALHFAAKFDALEVFIALMKHGADPFVLDAKRRTPFFLAAEYGVYMFIAKVKLKKTL